MNRKLIIIIGSVFFLLVASIIFYAVYQKFFNKNTTLNYINDQSEFKKLDLKRFENNTSEMIRLLTLPEYWKNWTWDKKMIEAEIVTVIPEYSEFIIRISRPFDQKFSKLRQRVKINCPKEETILVSSHNPTQSLSDGGFDIFQKVEKQDIFYGYCMDENCLNIGEECVLVKRIVNNE